MITKIGKKNRLRSGNFLVEPDEIFLDSKNLQKFDRQQFEGRIEKPIPKRTILFLGVFFVTFFGIFGVRLGYLQIEKGEAYFTRSENNTLEKVLIFADRGIIYDRNGNELAWNKKSENNTEKKALDIRAYHKNGFSHILGYVSYPAKDSDDNYWQTDFIGKDGLEKQYNDKIRGKNGYKIVETDARGEIHGENIVNSPERGEDLQISIDARVQEKLFTLIKQTAEASGFTGGAGMIMNIENGEIIVSTSYPEYNSEILSLGKDVDTINTYLKDKKKVFLNRNTSGLYTPGSIVKPFFALGALAENVIDPFKEILSTGSISIPNPYFPDQKTIFKDWKAHGWTNMQEALAVSSDVYFYTIGGGYEDQKGLGIVRLEKYARLFGMGEKVGVDLPSEAGGTIPNPEWKLRNFNGDPWRLGNTYHTSIGQYGFQVTPIQMLRATAAIGNGGKLVTPHFLLEDEEMKKKINIIELEKEQLEIIIKGMREAVTYGTAASLNVPYVKIAAKTGTAELGLLKNRVNSWVVGFFPYDNPKYVFTIMMESGPAVGSVNASSVMRQLLDYMSIYTPEYFTP
ncbi:MAG: penicillin-binding transpeptidase domain-containing protein [Candidatus Paceibacterota bacterium]